MTCNTDFALFKVINRCVETHTAITNCIEYNDDSTCKTCADGFFLDAPNCSALPSNCKEGTNATTCTTCNDGYALNFDNKCIKAYNV